MAAKYGKVRVAELLLERQAHPNAAGKVSVGLAWSGESMVLLVNSLGCWWPTVQGEQPLDRATFPGGPAAERVFPKVP